MTNRRDSLAKIQMVIIIGDNCNFYRMADKRIGYMLRYTVPSLVWHQVAARQNNMKKNHKFLGVQHCLISLAAKFLPQVPRAVS